MQLFVIEKKEKKPDTPIPLARSNCIAEDIPDSDSEDEVQYIHVIFERLDEIEALIEKKINSLYDKLKVNK